MLQGPPYRWPTIAKAAIAPAVDPQLPGCGCTPGSFLRLAPPWTRSILSPKSASQRNYASSPRTPGLSESRSCPSYTPLPAHDREFPLMDSRICQTLAASPAEPGISRSRLARCDRNGPLRFTHLREQRSQHRTGRVEFFVCARAAARLRSSFEFGDALEGLRRVE